MRKWEYLLLFFLIGPLRGVAQQPDLYFKKITTENGLSNNKVKCILQDRRGFIWLGTEDGLNRFDGNHFVIFRHEPSSASGISGNIITDLLEDDDGVIWIATEDGGLNRYDYRLPPREQFRQFKHLPNDTSSIPVNVINCLLEDKTGNLWLATSGASVLRFNKKQFIFDYRIQVGKTIYDLCMDSKGIIWAGRQGGSILKINPLTGDYEVQKEYDNFYLKLPHVVVTKLFRDRQDNIWFGSWDKVLYRYNAATRKEETFAADGSPYSFAVDEAISFNEDSQQRIWIGGRYNGLYVYDKADNRFYNFRHDPAREGSLNNNTVNTIFIDRSENVWLGTNSGLSIYSPSQQQFTQVFLEAPKKPLVIYDFFKNSKKSLWIGTSQGLFIRDAYGSTTHKPLFFGKDPLQVTKFFKDVDGQLYIGTDYSFFRFDSTNFQVVPLENTADDVVMKKLIESRVVSAVRDTINGNPVLLVSPYGHFVAYYDLFEKRWISRQDTVQKITARYNISDNLVRKLLRSRNGSIWMANMKDGLGEWRGSAGMPIRYLKNDPKALHTISNNNVYDVLEDERNNLWVSTYGGGLNHFNIKQGAFSHIRSSSNLLEGIQTDEKGNVWMIGNGNLHKYDIRRQSYTSFVLPDMEHSGGVRGYIYKDDQGAMYAAGTNYYVRFHPDSIKVTNTQPEVIFTDFRIFNTSYSDLLFKDSIKLQYDQNFFTFEYAAPYFDGGSEVHYSYMLQGVDKDWVEAGNRNFASYPNISGGIYHFKVRATANPGVWNNQPAMIVIEIIPPFWKRWWFYALCVIFTSLLVYAVYRYRINELLKRQAIRNKIAQDLHDNVGSTLSSISIYSQVAQIKSQQHNEPELIGILDKIGTTSNEMISEMNDIVWTINPGNDNMEKILMRMESFAKPLLAARNIQFHYTYDQHLAGIDLDMRKRRNFYLIFKESVNNTLKYSGAKNLYVHISAKRHSIELLVRDDGTGFDMDKLQGRLAHSMSGNGLRNMQIRAKEMKGQFTITSEAGKGTTVRLIFPIT